MTNATETILYVRRFFNEFKTALDTLGLRSIDDDTFNKRCSITGLIDCYPFAVIDDSKVVALRADAEPENNKPVVAVVDIINGESFMICSGIEHFIPIWIVSMLVNIHSDKWQLWENMGDIKWSNLECFQKKLGNHVNLNSLKKCLTREDLKASFCCDLAGDAYEKLLPDVISMVAPSDGRGEFQKYLIQIMKNGWINDYKQSDFGAWQSPLETAMGVVADPPDKSELISILTTAFRKPDSHDASWTQGTGIGEITGTAGRSDGPPVLTANALVTNIIGNADNPYLKVAKTLTSENVLYNGKEHLQLAVNLKKTNDVSGAFQAALSAGFWMYKQFGKVSADVLLFTGNLSADINSENLSSIINYNLNVMGAHI